MIGYQSLNVHLDEQPDREICFKDPALKFLVRFDIKDK